MGDLFESLIAAIYLDCNRDLNFVWKICYRFLEKEISKFQQIILIVNVQGFFKVSFYHISMKCSFKNVYNLDNCIKLSFIFVKIIEAFYDNNYTYLSNYTYYLSKN